MSKEGSVAPKERVNIVYKPATGDAQSEVELPLKLMVIGDFTMQEDERALEDRNPISVDKDNFNDVLKAQQINLKFNVPSKLSEEKDAEIPIDLKIDKIQDFGPDAVVSQVPELANLIKLREALKALKGPLSNVPQFRKKIQEIIGNEEARKALFDELGIEEEAK